MPRRRVDDFLIFASLNPTAFLELNSHLVNLGYSLHWIAGNPRWSTHRQYHRRKAGCENSAYSGCWVAPLRAELCTLVAYWEPVLGVPMLFDTMKVDASSLLPRRSAIREFEIRIPPPPRASNPWVNSSFMLVLKTRSVHAPNKTMRRLLDDRRGDLSTSAREMIYEYTLYFLPAGRRRSGRQPFGWMRR
jgi:hypothetical protein